MENKKTEIKICMGSSCFARGNNDNLEYIEKYIFENNIEAKIDLIGLRCENKCNKGPVIIINGTEYNNVDLEQLEKLLKDI